MTACFKNLILLLPVLLGGMLSAGCNQTAPVTELPTAATNSSDEELTAAQPNEQSGVYSASPAGADVQPTNEANAVASGSADAAATASTSTAPAAVPDLEEIFTDDTKSATSSESLKTLTDLREERDATVWRMERRAQQHEQAIVRMWDQLLSEQRKGDAGDPIAVLANQMFDSIRIGTLGEAVQIGWDAVQQTLDQQPQVMDSKRWNEFANAFREAGYEIEQTEWHHAKFLWDADEGGRSTIRMALYVRHPQRETRHVIGGNLRIRWHPVQEAELPVMRDLDATELQVFTRQGQPGFEHWFSIDHTLPDSRAGVQPISVRDFNGDGLNEIVLAGCNELYWNDGSGKFRKDDLLTFPERGFEVSLVADVTGDGVSDFVFPGLAGDLLMFAGDDKGRFSTPPKGKARGGGPLRQPQVIAAGDIDQDGDIDLWIGQYKISYVGGQMPTPYYDANDGFPAFLLINDGEGRFTPRTEEAGLGEKARRRSYSGSFVDLDGDRDLDLVVASDFAGLDVYLNDGSGKFTDVSETMLDQRHLFGMSVTFADYDTSGTLDFFATGMASTTARRLDQMGLGRTDRPEVHKMRSIMGYGNRMLLQANDGQFAQPSFIDQVARTGWSWGSTSFDFDNDGHPDIFVANGHSSGESTKDHCSHFWCHDIYDATSAPDQEVFHVFQNSMKGYFDRTESWDGYQKNQLLLNRQGQGFVNLGYLMGVGHEYDGRAAISDDLDGDGRKDLLVVEDRWQDGQLLHVYRNVWNSEHHWIGVRLTECVGAETALGATVVLKLPDGQQRVSVVTAGDSIHAQHAPVVHFGLGDAEEVESIEIRFVSGRTVTLEDPAVDRYLTVK